MSIDKPKPSMAEIVEEEIQNQNGQNEFLRIRQVTNNFPFCLPGSDGKSLNTIRNNLYAAGKGQSFNPHQRYIDQFERDLREKGETAIVEELRNSGLSDKKIFSTFAQFDEDVVSAIDQSGVDIVALAQLIDQAKDGGVRLIDVIGSVDIYRKFILPVYIKLREMGYNLVDLYQS